ncbi:hypothetical protein PAEPH01_0554 [Pancytospora epiphaga]|nr:hypothetical protein PAEPH01_0554 [Pancytospora epiphaga]
MLFFPVVRAIAFAQNGTSTFLGELSADEDIGLVKATDRVLDFNLMDTEPPGLTSILSLGTRAIAFDRSNNRLKIEDLNRSSKSQQFKLVMLPTGSFVLQFEDGCVGYDPGQKQFMLVNCKENLKILKLNKTADIWNFYSEYGPLSRDEFGNPIGKEFEPPREFTGFSTDFRKGNDNIFGLRNRI